jgi:hypothetical protein
MQSLIPEVSFCFTDPIELFCFLRRTAFSAPRHVRSVNLSLCLRGPDPFTAEYWGWVAGGIMSLPSLREFNLWLQWGSPNRREAPYSDAGKLLALTRGLFRGVKVPVGVRVSVSVPIDEDEGGSGEDTTVTAGRGKEDRIGRYAIVRRGASHFRPADDDPPPREERRSYERDTPGRPSRMLKYWLGPCH